MKRLIVILLAVLYVGSVSGITINRHYCGGKLASITIKFLNEEHRCGCGSKKMKKSCCKNENIVVKVKGEHKVGGKPAVSNEFFKIITRTFSELKVNLSKGALVPFLRLHDPPPKPNNSLLVLNRVFRI